MNLHGKVPVEKLDDERLTNIERKLVVSVSEMRAPAERVPRRMLAFAGVAMAMAVAVVAGYKLRGRADVVAPRVEDAPQRLAIDTEHGNTIDLGDAVLASGPSSHMVVERSKTRVVIQLARGTVDLNVKHDPSRVLVVRAGDTDIEDIGTHFSVAYDGAKHVEVRVTEGEVSVARGAQHTNIEAGFAWTDDRGKLAISALDQVAQATEVAAPVQAETPAAGTPAHPAAADPVVAPDKAAGSGSNAASQNGSGSGSAATPAHKAGKSNARVALEKLAIEEPLDVGTKDFNTAISKYLELAVSMGEDQDKTQVLYSIAVMQHRAHQDKAALYTLSGVIKRQGGKAYKAALWLNVRIECMQQFDDECRQAADLYLRKVPDGVAAGVAQTILTEIARQ